MSFLLESDAARDVYHGVAARTLLGSQVRYVCFDSVKRYFPCAGELAE